MKGEYKTYLTGASQSSIVLWRPRSPGWVQRLLPAGQCGLNSPPVLEEDRCTWSDIIQCSPDAIKPRRVGGWLRARKNLMELLEYVMTTQKLSWHYMLLQEKKICLSLQITERIFIIERLGYGDFREEWHNDHVEDHQCNDSWQLLGFGWTFKMYGMLFSGNGIQMLLCVLK